MSGPKSSQYTLLEAERRRQEELRRQQIEAEGRRLEELRCRDLDAQIAVGKNQLKNLWKNIESTLAQKIAEAKKELGQSCGIEASERLLANLSGTVQALPKQYGDKKSGLMERYLDRILSLISELKVQHDGAVRQAVAQLSTEVKEHRIQVAEKDFLGKKNEVKKGPAISLQAPLPVVNQQKTVSLVKVLEDFYLTVMPYAHNELLPEKAELLQLLASVDDIASNKKVDADYKAGQIEMRTKTFLAIKKQFDRQIQQNAPLAEEFNQLMPTYHALCFLLQENPEKHLFNPAHAFQCVDELKKEIEQKQTMLRQKQEAAYIEKSVHEVMEELGCEVIATDLMVRPTRTTIQNMYAFKNETAISVYTSDNGSLMFEVTGVKHDDNELSSLEKLRVKEGMDAFCSQYPIIKERLRAKGIKLEAEDLKPADEKYARAVNITKKKVVQPRQKAKTKKEQLPQAVKHRENS